CKLPPSYIGANTGAALGEREKSCRRCLYQSTLYLLCITTTSPRATPFFTPSSESVACRPTAVKNLRRRDSAVESELSVGIDSPKSDCIANLHSIEYSVFGAFHFPLSPSRPNS